MPDDVQHRIDEPGFAKRTATHLEIHNVYGMLNSEGTYEGMLALRPNERPFVMTRASFARRSALRRDVDGRQQFDLESPADDHAAVDEPRAQRLFHGGSRRGRVRRLSLSRATHQVA